MLFFTLSPTLTIQNKYFGTFIPDLFSQISDTKFSWQKLADEKLSSLLISFVQNIGDTMIIGFLFGYMLFSCNFRGIEAFYRLKRFELILF